jgi:hypothetical protein
MRRLIALLSIVLLTIFVFTGCVADSYHSQPQLPDTTPAQQAQYDLDRSVALVSNFGELAPGGVDRHQPFCSGVWVGADQILTAAHCIRGLEDMQHKLLALRALIQAGVPSQLAIMIVSAGVEDIDLDDDDDSPAGLKEALAIIKQIPHQPLMSLMVAYVVPSQVTDVGLRPLSFQSSRPVFIDERMDLAVLRTDGFRPAHGIAHIGQVSPPVGEDVTMTGNIHGNFFSYRQQQVSAYRHTEKYDDMDDIDGPFMQLSGATLAGGDSGSGVFDTHGNLVGIVSFVGPSIQLSYCIHMDTIRKVLIGQKIIKANIDTGAKDPDLSDAPLNLE